MVKGCVIYKVFSQATNKRMDAARLCISVFLFSSVVITSGAISTLAMLNKSVPMDLIFAVASYEPDKHKKTIAAHSNRIGCTYLHYRKIPTLYGWDFRQQNVSCLDLSGNHIKKISDQMTFFGDIKFLDLWGNAVEYVDLSRTKIERLILSKNKISSASFTKNHLFFPSTLINLDLSRNKIKKLTNYRFPQVSNRLNLSECNTTSIQNVSFNAKRIEMWGNPIQQMDNVTFYSLRFLYMEDCNVTLSEFMSFGIRFIGTEQFWLCLDESNHLLFVENHRVCARRIDEPSIAHVSFYGKNQIHIISDQNNFIGMFW